MTKVLVCGGRNYNNREKLYSTLNNLDKEYNFIEVIEGGALGADILAAQWAIENNKKKTTFKADWSKGRSAGPIRNLKMLKEGKPDLIIAFPGGRGTQNMIKQAKLANLPIYEISRSSPP